MSVPGQTAVKFLRQLSGGFAELFTCFIVTFSGRKKFGIYFSNLLECGAPFDILLGVLYEKIGCNFIFFHYSCFDLVYDSCIIFKNGWKSVLFLFYGTGLCL